MQGKIDINHIFLFFYLKKTSGLFENIKIFVNKNNKNSKK